MIFFANQYFLWELCSEKVRESIPNNLHDIGERVFDYRAIKGGGRVHDIIGMFFL